MATCTLAWEMSRTTREEQVWNIGQRFDLDGVTARFGGVNDWNEGYRLGPHTVCINALRNGHVYPENYLVEFRQPLGGGWFGTGNECYITIRGEDGERNRIHVVAVSAEAMRLMIEGE